MVEGPQIYLGGWGPPDILRWLRYPQIYSSGWGTLRYTQVVDFRYIGGWGTPRYTQVVDPRYIEVVEVSKILRWLTTSYIQVVEKKCGIRRAQGHRKPRCCGLLVTALCMLFHLLVSSSSSTIHKSLRPGQPLVWRVDVQVDCHTLRCPSYVGTTFRQWVMAGVSDQRCLLIRTRLCYIDYTRIFAYNVLKCSIK